jgi:hypothetical protein
MESIESNPKLHVIHTFCFVGYKSIYLRCFVTPILNTLNNTSQQDFGKIVESNCLENIIARLFETQIKEENFHHI